MKFWISPWIEFPLAVLVLLAGVVLISTAAETFGAATPVSSVLSDSPLGIVLAASIVVPLLEALVWSVAFVEGAALLLKRPWAGAIFGTLAYGVAYHWSADIWAMLCASWLGFVTSGMYAHIRGRSRLQAYAHVVGLRWSFVGFALALSRGWL